MDPEGGYSSASITSFYQDNPIHAYLMVIPRLASYVIEQISSIYHLPKPAPVFTSSRGYRYFCYNSRMTEIAPVIFRVGIYLSQLELQGIIAWII